MINTHIQPNPHSKISLIEGTLNFDYAYDFHPILPQCFVSKYDYFIDSL